MIQDDEYFSTVIGIEFFSGPFHRKLGYYQKIGPLQNIVPTEIIINSTVTGSDERTDPEIMFELSAKYVLSSLELPYGRVRYDYVSQVSEGEIAETQTEPQKP